MGGDFGRDSVWGLEKERLQFIEDGKDEGNNSTAGGAFMKPYDLLKGSCM